MREIAIDTERHEAGRQTRAVAKQTNALALEVLWWNETEKRRETTPYTATIHVATEGGYLDGRTDSLLEALLGKRHERLLNNFVGHRFLVIHITEFWSYFGKGWSIGIAQVVVVK